MGDGPGGHDGSWSARFIRACVEATAGSCQPRLAPAVHPRVRGSDTRRFASDPDSAVHPRVRRSDTSKVFSFCVLWAIEVSEAVLGRVAFEPGMGGEESRGASALRSAGSGPGREDALRRLLGTIRRAVGIAHPATGARRQNRRNPRIEVSVGAIRQEASHDAELFKEPGPYVIRHVLHSRHRTLLQGPRARDRITRSAQSSLCGRP